MDISSIKVTTASTLGISVSGTDYLRKSAAAGVLPGVLPVTQLQKDAAAGRETVEGALRRVSADTIKAIETALSLGNADSAERYRADGGKHIAQGTYFRLEA